MQSRKLVALDETHFLGDWSAGRALFTRLGRDSRKWNTCVLAASQNPSDVLGHGRRQLHVRGLRGPHRGRGRGQGRAADAAGRRPASATSARWPRSPRAGAQSALREFVMRDVDGNVDKICVDLSANPGLLEALNTTARARQPEDAEVATSEEQVA